MTHSLDFCDFYGSGRDKNLLMFMLRGTFLFLDLTVSHKSVVNTLLFVRSCSTHQEPLEAPY